MAEAPAEHPAIDWSRWDPPGEGDVRSPCPMLNALANHHVLPHSGRGITKPMAVAALTSSINLDASIAKVFSTYAVTANPDPAAHAFDLDHVRKHGLIEHDVSLSRGDAGVGVGDNYTFDPEIWRAVVERYEEGGATETNFASPSRARYARVEACKREHEGAGRTLEYGIKEVILSYGETALFLGLLGDPKDGKIPIKYLRVLFEEERLPYQEGWRPSDRPITQWDMNHLILSLVTANDHKAAEAVSVGLGTAQAVRAAVGSMMGAYCSVM